LATNKASSENGRNSANVATTAPTHPAAFYPTSVTSMVPGPGAPRATANNSMKPRPLTQAGPRRLGALCWRRSTTKHRRDRKTRLHRKEADFDMGSELPLFGVDGWSFGISICYDANFPEVASSLAQQGARLICYPLNNMLPPDVADRWRSRSIENLRQRAIETGCWVISADVVGEHEGMICHGCTRIISPAGEDVRWVTEGSEGVVVFDLQR
jgi:hypothetical protein